MLTKVKLGVKCAKYRRSFDNSVVSNRLLQISNRKVDNFKLKINSRLLF